MFNNSTKKKKSKSLTITFKKMLIREDAYFNSKNILLFPSAHENELWTNDKNTDEFKFSIFFIFYRGEFIALTRSVDFNNL